MPESATKIIDASQVIGLIWGGLLIVAITALIVGFLRWKGRAIPGAIKLTTVLVSIYLASILALAGAVQGQAAIAVISGIVGYVLGGLRDNGQGDNGSSKNRPAVSETAICKSRDYIESSPYVLRGMPRLKGTRIPVSLVLGYLADGKSAKEIIEEFPDLTEAQIVACLGYARDLSEIEVSGA